MEKKKGASCELPEGKGICGDGTCLRSDASQGWPPKEVEVACLVCVAQEEVTEDAEPEPEPEPAPPPRAKPEPAAVVSPPKPAPSPKENPPRQAPPKEAAPKGPAKPAATDAAEPTEGCSSANVSLTSWGLGAGLLGLLGFGTRRRRT